MHRSCVLTLACLAGLAGPAAHAADEPRLEPGVYLAIPFGGARAAPAGAQLSARLDYRAAGLPAPATLEWRLDGQQSALTLMGLPLAAGGGYRLNADAGEPTRGEKVASAIGIGAATTVLVGGLVVLALVEGMEGFGEALGDGMGEAMGEAFTGGGTEEEGSESPDPACTGVELGDECITTGGGGG